MADMHLMCDNMHKNGMFYVLIFIDNHITGRINFMLLLFMHQYKLELLIWLR